MSVFGIKSVSLLIARDLFLEDIKSLHEVLSHSSYQRVRLKCGIHLIQSLEKRHLNDLMILGIDDLSLSLSFLIIFLSFVFAVSENICMIASLSSSNKRKESVSLIFLMINTRMNM